MKKFTVILTIASAVILLSIYAWLKSFAPDYDAVISAPGLHENVTVTRNRYAVPTINAANDDDLYFVWGYINAQDRLCQLEVTRRIGQGRISEFAGPDTIEKDIFLRAVGFYRIAEEAAEQLEPETREAMQRYVDGINYYVDTRGPDLYTKLLGLEKEKWTIADPIMVGMMLNWSLAYNMKHELIYYKIAEKIGSERAGELFNFIPEGTSTIIGDEKMRLGKAVSLESIKKMGALAGSVSASNSWAIAPEKTADGAAILANDMHVHSSKTPSDFYLVRARSGSHDTAGAQVVGLPFIASGYNRDVAWGQTNQGADMVDLFIEEIDWTEKTYRRNGSAVPLGERRETFLVKGEDPVEKTIYYAGRRPMMNDVFTDVGADISLDWTGFDGISVSGFFRINRAENIREVIDGATGVKMTPQNMVFADRAGNIGYRVIGSLPIRNENTGNLPSDGTRAENNIKGYVPDREYPLMVNPPRGYIITANNKSLNDFGYFLNGTYAPGYRYENIAAMLREEKDVDVDYVKKMQTDTHTVLADKVIALLTKLVPADDERMARAIEMLEYWDGDVIRDSTAASIYNTFLVRFMHQTFSDELGEELAAAYIGERYITLERFFELIDKKSPFFDDIGTPETETADLIAARALEESLDILEQLTGSSKMENWAWGDIHFIEFEHLLGKSSLLRPFVNYGPLSFQGDGETNNRGRFDEVNPPFITSSAAASRLIVHFGPETRGHMILITGQNEYFLSPHNTDMTDAWMNGEYFCMETAEQVYETVFEPR